MKTINELLNKRSKSSNIDCLKDCEHTFVNKKAISSALNKNYRSVKFQFGSITVKEIRDAIAKIKTTKGFGKDNISCYFLKLAVPFIEKSLADLFNTSIETS